ncbi:hypothetical protein [Shimia sagamensis]|uniref:Uncharacterized protein n=1 Tax=Shimia sagamensis TaxID=1566352 RepID=A0ABY1PMR4_9RHOB|nr:hypothetical protein [Shimia sagamensis]SMP36037.1 hypothetical protein SAMN06265373_11334 [Shimia sagamensis]
MKKEHRFDLFRLSLRQRKQIDILDALEPKSREEWILALFSRETRFRHHGTDFVYVALDPKGTYPYIVGKIGREVSEIENTPPEDGYREVIHDAWKAAVVVVDPREHGDGQKLAIQYHQDVGTPSTLAPRLLQAMEEQQDWRPYLSSVHPITNTEAFWDFVRRNKGKVTYIRFELEVPNMFGGDDEYDKEMQAYRDEENAQKIAIEVKNPDGVDAETERVRFTAEKAMGQGTGNVKARAVGKRNNFSSQNQQESARIPVETNRSQRPLIERAAEIADRILGRDKD